MTASCIAALSSKYLPKSLTADFSEIFQFESYYVHSIDITSVLVNLLS